MSLISALFGSLSVKPAPEVITCQQCGGDVSMRSAWYHPEIGYLHRTCYGKAARVLNRDEGQRISESISRDMQLEAQKRRLDR